MKLVELEVFSEASNQAVVFTRVSVRQTKAHFRPDQRL